MRVLVSEQRDVWLELEPRVSLVWCEEHMAWHRLDARVYGLEVLSGH